MDLLQFVIERYNYWIFIVLMMTGLYTVIARGNLVKKIIGLNIFQTSVFIYYISIGKVRGGTAPIYVPGDMEARTDHHGHHGDDHHDDHDGDHGADKHGDDHHSDAHSETPDGDAHDNLHEGAANALPAASDVTHHAPTDVADHSGAANPPLTSAPSDDSHGDGVELHVADNVDHGDHGGHGDAYGGELVAEVLYSNPLPHVLILTAIVVGVATTAVGLALAVRIREAYGTIEEDELETADNIAEFGKADPRNGATASGGAA